MKKMKKTLALVLALVMALALAVPAYAAHGDADDVHTVTINPNNDSLAHTYQAYQIFKGNLDADQGPIADNADPVQLNTIAWGDNVGTSGGATLIAALKADTKNFHYVAATTEPVAAEAHNDFTNCTDAADVAAVLATYGNDDANMRAFAEIVGETTGVLTGTPKEGTADAGSDVVIRGLVDGYYFIKDKDGTQSGENGSYSRFLLRVVGNTTVVAKDVLPDINKVIVVNNTDVKASNGSIGDKVDYKVTGKVPNMDGYNSYVYKISDEMTNGLTFNDDIVVKVNNDTLQEVMAVGNGADTKWYPVKDNNGTLEADTTQNPVTAGYIVTRTSDQKFEVYILNFIQYNTADYVGKDIVVTYSATINQSALITGDATPVADGNKNTAKLTYSNNPNTSDKGTNGEPETTNPTGTGPEKEVNTYVTGIELLKVDGQDDSKMLEGAVFTLTGANQNITIVKNDMYVLDAKNGTLYMLKDGTYTSTVPGSTVDGKVVSADDYVSTTDKYTKITTVTKDYNDSATSTAIATTDSYGLAAFTGLGEGVYTLTETSAPTGYNLLDKPIYFYVKFNQDATDNTKGNFAVYQYVGTASSVTAAPSAEDLANTSLWKALTADGNNVETHFDFTILNNAGSVLPSTGGIGTKIFYALGAVLVVGAGAVLVSRKRVAE